MARGQYSEVIAEYMTAMGVSRRTAQRACKSQAPEFVQFMAAGFGKPTASAVSVIKAKHLANVPADSGEVEQSAPDQMPPAWSKDAHKRTVEEQAECDAWILLDSISKNAQKFVKEGHMLGPVYSRARSDAQEAYYKARQKRVSAELEAHRLVPVQEWVRFKSSITKVAAAVGSLREIAARANPAAPGVAMAVIDDWFMQRFNPMVVALMKEADETLEAAA